ncbi:MAG: hypothetical protein PHS02_04120 [Candidatus ainarchaeum sp.]|nr:hypothetical protein [Candidatus ainarchaeum sp.]
MAMNRSMLFSYGSAGLAALCALGSFSVAGQGGPLALAAGVIAAAGAVLAVLFYNFGYIFVPLLTQWTRTVVVTDTGYEIPPSQDVILKKGEGGSYYASMFLGIRIFESASEKNMDQNIAYNEFFERAISNLKFVTKISYLLYVEDVSEKRKVIETRRAESQLRLAREREKTEPDVLKLDRYEREVAKWDSELNKLIKGIKPMGVIAYAMTTATGITKESAIAVARNQCNELKAVLANALNVEIEILSANEMLKTFDWEKMIPSTGQELEESVI